MNARDESELAVFADLVRLYPNNEGYLKKYAELLIADGQHTAAREVLQRLHQLLIDKGKLNDANSLLEEHPEIGRIPHAAATRKPIIELLPHEVQNKIWRLLHQQRIKEGRHLFHQGDQGDTLYLLLKGELAVFTKAEKKTVLLNLIKPGEVVGEDCFLEPGVRNADVVANKDSIVIKLPRKKMLRALLDIPGLEAELKHISTFRRMVALLSINPMLQKLPMEMRQAMARATEIRSYAKDALIHQAGEETQAVDMLVRGKAAYMLSVNQRRHILHELAIGELIGDTAAIRKSSCPADLIAISDIIMAHIPYSCFKNITEAYPPLKEELMNHAEKQREALMRAIAALHAE